MLLLVFLEGEDDEEEGSETLGQKSFQLQFVRRSVRTYVRSRLGAYSVDKITESAIILLYTRYEYIRVRYVRTYVNIPVKAI